MPAGREATSPQVGRFEVKRTLVFVLALLAARCAVAQSLPVKAGLWENIVYDDDGKPNITSLACMTPTSFAEAMTKVNSTEGCKLSVHDVTSHGMVVDMSCDRKTVQMQKHSVLEVVDSEHVKSTMTMKTTVNGKASDTTTKAAARFKSASCGDVKPNQPKIVTEE